MKAKSKNELIVSSVFSGLSVLTGGAVSKLKYLKELTLAKKVAAGVAPAAISFGTGVSSCAKKHETFSVHDALALLKSDKHDRTLEFENLIALVG